ncbi:hypothetical protein NPX13_g7743 [Xylaria arbuscula]|uniref:Uncharacterized protein n=1 Tax=Xylaria arbuscula TaxID=114810 RepID=A0A9W8NA43_9PEZI|nr:hypothetical protein NPX13_g7743 [Xylaria arbuscula]
MRYSYIVATSGLLASVSGHGLVTSIQGANGVTMPGLSAMDAVLKQTPASSATVSSAQRKPVLWDALKATAQLTPQS